MIKKLFMLLAAAMMLTGVFAAPASASVPDWDSKLAVHTPAEWDAIKTVLNSPEDLAFVHNLPASPAAMAKRNPTDCPPEPPTGANETFCLWNGYGWSGTRWDIPRAWLGDTNGVNDINGLSFYGSGINNASKSWYNRTYYTVRLYDRDDCNNGLFARDMKGGQVAVSFDASSNDWENRFSSISISAYAGYYCYSTPGQ